ncbi:MAG: diacylglycerol kinase [Victivallales bacterium]|jgi:diacylglycerol kinase (ATP)|nr:diacylglycerol kinase [Victivallales bacterium]
MSRTGFYHLIDATRFSMAGLRAMLSETAFRHELLVGIIFLPLAWLLPSLGFGWRVAMTIAWIALPTTEILNTAIEAVVDLVSPEIHPLAKKAKDCGSAAVFCVCVANAILWIAAFWHHYLPLLIDKN